MRTLLPTVAAILFAVSSCTLQEMSRGGGTQQPPKMSAHFHGLRTAKYTTTDLAAAKAWYSDVLELAPYFDEPFYVGFNVGGFELGIVPDSSAAGVRSESGVAYWGVADAKEAYARLLDKGATAFEPVQDVGGGVMIGAVRDPFGNILGVVENPHFNYETPRTAGPGR